MSFAISSIAVFLVCCSNLRISATSLDSAGFIVKPTAKRDVTSADQQVLTTTQPTGFPDVYDGCERTKGCFSSPGPDCIATKTCSMVATYQLTNDNNANIEIYGQNIQPNSYVAIGFSTDRIMGDDVVIQCVNFNGNASIFTAVNVSPPNKNNIRTQAVVGGTQLISSAYVNGQLYCRFSQRAVYTVTDSNAINLMSIDLRNGSYYLMMAIGPTGPNQIQYHQSRVVSDNPITFSSSSLVGGASASRSKPLMQLHGSLMVIAWLMAASVGILMPRYLRDGFKGRKLMGKDLWFVIHMGMMVLVWSLTIAAFIVIFVDAGGWVGNTAHPIIGCITTALAFIQPIMAAFRPEPNTPKRPIFNWLHFSVGYSAYILGITSIFLAVDLSIIKLSPSIYGILIAHVVFVVVLHLLLNVLCLKCNDETRKLIINGKPPSQLPVLMRRSLVGLSSLIAFGLGIAVIVLISQA